MLTAKDLAARYGYAPRTARRLLAKLRDRGLATTVQTGGRPALAVDADTAERVLRLSAFDLEDLAA